MTMANNQNQNIYLIKMHQWRMAFWGLVILLAGIVIGVSSILIVQWRFIKGPRPGPEIMVNRMVRGLQHELDLSRQQRDKIEPIIHKHMSKLDEIRRNARPLIEQEMRLMNEEIALILNPEQKILWERMLRNLPIEPGPGQRPPENQGPFGQPPPPRPEGPSPGNIP
jgi:hypothetical protein